MDSKNQNSEANKQASNTQDLMGGMNFANLPGIDLGSLGIPPIGQNPALSGLGLPDNLMAQLNQGPPGGGLGEMPKPQLQPDLTGLLGGTDLNSILAGLGTNPQLPNLSIPGLDQNFGMPAGLGGFPQLGGVGGGMIPGMNFGQQAQNFKQPLIPGSQAHQASFHQKGPDYEIKLFVGGLAFQTLESNLIEYFKKFGVVADAIVMRDRTTGRGRGFGFVKMQFENKDKAQENKMKLLAINSDRDNGHFINEKRVDVKSADDFVKPQGQDPMGGMGGQQNPMYGQHMAAQQQRFNPMQPPPQFNTMQPQDPLVHVNKPNPYVIVETKDELDDAHRNDPKEKPKEVVYKYPKSKIFVGGLDFKLTNQDLQQHFSQYGAIESAVILKNINNGQSRGFGFVTFKDEAVAQDLIQNMQTTNIFGRKVDIKSAEPKQQNSNQPAPIIPRGGYQQGPPPIQNGGFAMIPQYGGGGGGGDREQSPGSSRGSNREQYPERRRRDDRYARDYRDERDSYRHSSRRGYDDREGSRDRDRGRHRRHNYRSDSGDSQGSSSSYQRRSRRKDKRGPHHGSSHKTESKPEVKKDRSRSRSNNR